jgi:hypothetical protein
VRIFTSHLKPGQDPVLVREGGSFSAALLGWLWMLSQGKPGLLPAALLFGADLALPALLPPPARPLAYIALALFQGAFCRDMLRWELSRQGFAEGPVIAAENDDAALRRLIDANPTLIAPPSAGAAMGASL